MAYLYKNLCMLVFSDYLSQKLLNPLFRLMTESAPSLQLEIRLLGGPNRHFQIHRWRYYSRIHLWFSWDHCNWVFGSQNLVLSIEDSYLGCLLVEYSHNFWHDHLLQGLIHNFHLNLIWLTGYLYKKIN